MWILTGIAICTIIKFIYKVVHFYNKFPLFDWLWLHTNILLADCVLLYSIVTTWVFHCRLTSEYQCGYSAVVHGGVTAEVLYKYYAVNSDWSTHTGTLLEIHTWLAIRILVCRSRVFTMADHDIEVEYDSSKVPVVCIQSCIVTGSCAENVYF